MIVRITKSQIEQENKIIESICKILAINEKSIAKVIVNDNYILLDNLSKSDNETLETINALGKKLEYIIAKNI